MTGPCTAPQHGSRGAYVAGCRCPESRAANTAYAYARSRRLMHAQFGAAPPLTVPATQALAVLEQLLDAGWTRRRISDRTGLRRDRLARISGHTARPVRTVRYDTWKALVDLLPQPAPLAPGTLIDGTGTYRRLHALIANGWPKTTLAAELGVGRALQFRTDQVTARTAEKVRILYDRLNTTPGPSAAARAYGQRLGYLTPGWWDDDTIDNPAHNPVEAAAALPVVDEVAVQRAIAGERLTLTPREKGEVIARMLAAGHTRNQAAAAVRCNGNDVARFLRLVQQERSA